MVEPPTVDSAAGEPADRLDLEAVAEWVVNRGLAVPAVLALEMHRPLAHLGSQALLVSAPLLAPLLGLRRFEDLVALLADAERYAALLDRIEERALALQARERAARVERKAARRAARAQRAARTAPRQARHEGRG